MLRRFLSYFYPIRETEQLSETGQTLEINWNNGHLVMDSANANYSYGSLQRILRTGLKEIGFDNIRKMDNILLLGVAGGSVIKTLVTEILFRGKITGVEIDATAIELAEKYFGIKASQKLEIVHGDARDFILNNLNKYDLIIVDVFNDTEMPGFLFESDFIRNLVSSLDEKGFIIFNTMKLASSDGKRNFKLAEDFRLQKLAVMVLDKLEGYNELLIAQS